MEKAVMSLVPGGEEVEIIVVDDGSKDRTAQIADELEQRYPGIVRAIHQENGGHGDAVMTGLQNASGLYFKVVDSDDWADAEAYPKILNTLRSLTEEPVDMLISNYIYDKAGAKHKHVMRYRHALPQGRVFGWEETKPFPKGQYMLMHSVIYRTQLLRDCGLSLPKHTFYVDELYVYHPLPYDKKMYYLDVDFYRYFIGRADQSVNEKVMISRIDQQIKVNKMMIDAYNLYQIQGRQLRNYMFNYLEIITIVSTVMCLRSGTEENLQKKRELWGYIKAKDIRMFHRLRNGILGQTMNMPGEGGRKFGVAAYLLMQKTVGFN